MIVFITAVKTSNPTFIFLFGVLKFAVLNNRVTFTEAYTDYTMTVGKINQIVYLNLKAIEVHNV
jgi:hypothetical protein